eukprot:10469455-Karenia_brevis.AAC.1
MVSRRMLLARDEHQCWHQCPQLLRLDLCSLFSFCPSVLTCLKLGIGMRVHRVSQQFEDPPLEDRRHMM